MGEEATQKIMVPPDGGAGEGSGAAEILKATIYSVEQGESHVRPAEDLVGYYSDHGIIPPYIEPLTLVNLFDKSNALRPNIDAYMVNIEGFGHQLKPVIDTEAEDADEKITDAIILEKLHDGDSAPVVMAVELGARKIQIKAAARIERMQLEMFFRQPTADLTMVDLRMRLRQDLEVTGNAYIEVIRNRAGQISMLEHAQSITMRLRQLDPVVTSDVKRRVSAITVRDVEMPRRWRTFAQRLTHTRSTKGWTATYFKQLGDPRTVSAETGRAFVDVAALKQAEPTARVATEMLHFKIPHPRYAYGMPRWLGALMAVVGTRSSEEVNASYFDSKTIPPGFLLVSGGTLGSKSKDKLEQYLKEHVKGREKFWSIIVIEAEGKSNQSNPNMRPPRVQIEWVPMTSAQPQDALFQNYEERNTEKVGNQFRLPKILRGDAKDFNRSTADASLRYAEQQVFQPERERVDSMINNVLFPHMGVRYWEFVSNSPVTRDPVELSEILERLANILTPNEQRRVVGDIINDVLPDIEEQWGSVPLEVLKLQAAALPPAPGAPVSSELAGKLEVTDKDSAILLFDALAGFRARLEEAVLAASSRDTAAAQVEVAAADTEATQADPVPEADIIKIKVPAGEFYRLFAKLDDEELEAMRKADLSVGDIVAEGGFKLPEQAGEVAKPVGPYASFDACVLAVLDGDPNLSDKDARAICAQIEQDSEDEDAAE